MQQLPGGGRGLHHEISPQVMVTEIHIGLVQLPSCIEGSDPELEELLEIRPSLRRHPVGEDVHKAGGIEGLREGHHSHRGLSADPQRDD